MEEQTRAFEAKAAAKAAEGETKTASGTDDAMSAVPAVEVCTDPFRLASSHNQLWALGFWMCVDV